MITDILSPVHQALEESDYVQEAFRVAAGLAKTSLNKLPAIPRRLQKIFVRAEEYENDERDQWGNWEYSYSDSYKRGQLWVPECDLWLQEQQKQLKEAGEKLAPRWPKGHDFAVCLTHDVDYIGEMLSVSQRCRDLLRSLRAYDLVPLQRLLGAAKGLAKLLLKRPIIAPRTTNTLEISYLIEKELGVTASYFFTVPPKSHLSKYDCLYDVHDKCRFLEKTRQVRDVMSFLCQEGFDVGLHGSYFSAIENNMLIEQKTALEKAIQAPVHTTRQHWLHLQVPRTMILQEQAGFLADTTLGFNRNIGFRAGTSLPFYPYERTLKRQLNLIEVPLIIQDGALVGNNALEYTPSKAFDVVKEFVLRIQETGGCLTFLFHPDIFLKPGLADLYRSIIKYSLSQNAWVTDLNQIQAWWRERTRMLA